MFNYFILILLVACGAQCFSVLPNSVQEKSFSMDVTIETISKKKASIATKTFKDGKNYPLNRKPIDCADVLLMGHNKSGVYEIWPINRMTEGKSLFVYCDMDTDRGGWTVIQRRGEYKRPIDYFYKDWISYKEGFGNIEKDFWLGNDNIYALTNQKLYSVRFDLQDDEKNRRYAHYDKFWLDDENHKYTLHIADYSGDAGDSMIKQHNNRPFSTKDQDNDNNAGNCAELYKGAWWYDTCHSANLNGLYYNGFQESYADGINWFEFRGFYYSLSWTEIKIRPKNFRIPLPSEIESA